MDHPSTQASTERDDLPAVDRLMISSTETAQSLGPITNFQLPLELRQGIYGYLLDGDRVKVTTKKGETE